MDRRARTHHNSLQPICRLAPSLLSDIFTFLILPTPALCHANSWITITFVCSHFRRVALTSPLLWAHIAFPLDRTLRETMVVRAQTVPLRLDALWSVGPGDAPFISTHIGRAAALRLVVDRHQNNVLMRSLGGRAAPVLQSLDFSMTNAASDAPALPAGFLADGAPRLRHLRLQTKSLDVWACPLLLRDLRSLDIMYQSDMPKLPSVDAVLGALSGLAHCLVRLSLDIGNPPADTEQAQGSKTSEMVNLPLLTSMFFRTRMTRGASLLQYTALPHTATLRIELVHSSEAEAASLEATLPKFLNWPRIQAYGGSFAPTAFKRISVAPSEPAQRAVNIVIKAWHSLRGTGEPDSSLHLDALSVWCRRRVYAPIPPLAPAVLDALATTQLEELVIDEVHRPAEADGERDIARLSQAMKKITGLRVLEMHGSITIAIAGLAFEELFPELEVLRLQAVDDAAAVAARESALAGYRAWAAARKEAGHAVVLELDATWEAESVSLVG
ncbi:hypothetical protein FA95DRAFT_1037188 [Auriscalpium vulgare]|uniref:Uncharacterized protein n=1 Tax=Auriscalpium vulgare TaxID=40419 RepID=A0ACB8RWW0_9AGAM|nr:hypothetical protein FA95DRAFT_1037188 [Auriscalpium vulgare]